MFTLLLLWGWNVLFIAVVIYLLSFPKSAAGPSGTCPVLGCKFKHFILNRQRNECIFHLFLSFDCRAFQPFPRMAEWTSPRWLALMLHVLAEDAIRGDGGTAVSPSARCGLTRRRTQALNNCSHTMATAPGLLSDDCSIMQICPFRAIIVLKAWHFCPLTHRWKEESIGLAPAKLCPVCSFSLARKSQACNLAVATQWKIHRNSVVLSPQVNGLR